MAARIGGRCREFDTATGTHATINVPSRERPMVASSEGGCCSAATGVDSLFLFGVDMVIIR
jgi:hypothetical protein